MEKSVDMTLKRDTLKIIFTLSKLGKIIVSSPEVTYCSRESVDVLHKINNDLYLQSQNVASKNVTTSKKGYLFAQ